MDERQALTNEMMLKALMNKSNEGVDMIQLMASILEDIDKGVKDANRGIAAVKEDTECINSKIDIVLEKLEGLESAFEELKSENRTIEDKLTLMNSKLSKLDSSVEVEELEDFYVLSQSKYDNWDELDELTRKFIPLAEFLYSKLQKYDKTDFSPVILELCRAIENEFLLKIFTKYTLDLINRKGNTLQTFFTTDMANRDLQDKTGQFVKAVNKAAKNHKPEYTLGQMNMILSIASDTQVVRRSPLMKDFVDYLEKNTEARRLLDSQYIRKVNDIVNKYRNPSAHPEFMPLEKANECREIMPDRLDYLMDCVAPV